MCGICGIVDFDGQTGTDIVAATKNMTVRLAHRGPDDKGLWHDSGIVLGHRRLAVIDLAGSIQPMQDRTGRYVIVFNGEIYNYIELRQELNELGIRFRSSGDTEVLLNAYILFGPACLDRINGMFAFAVWDRREKVLFAARDRLGVKPLYYARGQGNLLLFASELQAMRGLPIDFSVDPKSLVQYLRHGFIRSPATIFQGVKELRPGHFLRYVRDGIEVRRYWEPPLPDPAMGDRPVHELSEELRELLRSAVHLRLRSDVPLGAFLSGGIDSSIIVAAMKDLGESAIHSYAIGFEDDSFDETLHAKEVADYLDSVHHMSRVTMVAEDLLPDLVRHYGQPYGDSSCIPTWHLCRKTREHVTVALSGDGGDELFCGYRRYTARRLLRYYRYLPKAFRNEVLPFLAGHLSEGIQYYDDSLIKKLHLFIALDQRLEKDPRDIYPGYFTLDELDRLLNGVVLLEGEGYEDTLDIPANDRMGEIDSMMRADLLHYLPDDILTKVDRASMAHALEVRSPFMDYRVVEFACRLPLSLKLRGLTTKFLLRQAFSRDLPRGALKRRKHGFAVPLGEWFQNSLEKAFEEIVLTDSSSGFLVKSEATRLLNEHQRGKIDHGNRLWLLLFLQAWQGWWRDG
jgi:asparagine synthase (glutamine-hydrolysing)